MVQELDNHPGQQKDSPLVSVIIIFLNEEQFLEEAVESVLAQTYSHWELLLVDDGSTDRSTEIARRYEQKYPDKIRYLEHPHHENRGMSAARNLGIRNARGRYIAYLDGDDVWLPEKLARQVGILCEHPEAVMVYGPLLCWYSWTGNAEDRGKDFLYGLDDVGIHLEGDQLIPPPKLLSLFLVHKALIPAGILIERRVLEEVGCAEEEFRGNYEDAVVLVKVCLRWTVYVSRACWYKYRIHPDSCARVTRRMGLASATQRRFLEWVEHYFQQEGVRDPMLQRALRRALRPHRHPRVFAVTNAVRNTLDGMSHRARRLAHYVVPAPIRQILRSLITKSFAPGKY